MSQAAGVSQAVASRSMVEFVFDPTDQLELTDDPRNRATPPECPAELGRGQSDASMAALVSASGRCGSTSG
jgi:hypothetical protein